MMAGSHVVVGLVAWVYAAPKLGLDAFDPVSLALVPLGALLPDVDHPKSWLGRRIPALSVPLAFLVGHRGVTHSLLAVAACVAALRWDGEHAQVAAPLIVAYLSHLAADLLTPAGLRLAWPSHRVYALPLCKSGSPAEPFVVVGLALWCLSEILGIGWHWQR